MAGWTDEVKGRLGFGRMRLPGGGGESGYGKKRRIIDAFLGTRFNFFDTARPCHGERAKLHFTSAWSSAIRTRSSSSPTS